MLARIGPAQRALLPPITLKHRRVPIQAKPEEHSRSRSSCQLHKPEKKCWHCPYPKRLNRLRIVSSTGKRAIPSKACEATSARSKPVCAKRMVTDHQNAQDQLNDAAQKENITLPTTLSAKDQATYDRLSKLSGTQFDKAYAQDMVRDHTTDISKFKHGANSGKNASIKSFASQTLPTLEQDLNMAKQMSQTLSSSNNTNSSAKPTS